MTKAFTAKNKKYKDEMVQCMVDELSEEELADMDYVLYLHDGTSYDLKKRRYIQDDDL